MNSEIIPIALFTYKRPLHLKKVLEAMKNNKVPLIYAFSDGPKNREETSLVNEARAILHQIDWCEVKIFERENNFGLAKNIRNGITIVLEEFDKVIVIEDDIVMLPNAYDYTVQALKHYENSGEVMSVSMWSDPFISGKLNAEGFFSERFVCWGWGTYKKYWDTYTEKPIELYKRTQQLNMDVLKWGKDIKVQAEAAEERDLWYVGYLLQHFLAHKVSYFPKNSLVINIGVDGTGENSGTQKISDQALEHPQIKPPANWPTPVINGSLAKKFALYFEHKTGSMMETVLKKLKKQFKK